MITKRKKTRKIKKRMIGAEAEVIAVKAEMERKRKEKIEAKVVAIVAKREKRKILRGKKAAVVTRMGKVDFLENGVYIFF
jgi:UDP-N-acetylglucosamine:LPS N-acetylglucosamine transferase